MEPRLPIGTRIICLATRFGPEYQGAAGVIYGNRETLNTVWSDYAVQWDGRKPFPAFAVNHDEVREEAKVNG